VNNIAASTSQLAVLEAQEKQARIDLDRAEQLFKEGAFTAAQRDEARTKHDTLVSQIAAQRASESSAREQARALSTSGRAAVSQALAAQSNIAVSRALVAHAEVGVNECKLTAPRNGMVATRALEPGEAVQPGSIILTLTDLQEARTRFYLPNDALASAAPGRKVKVVADPYPGQSWTGTIFYVSPKAEFTPRNVQTREDRERLVYAVEVRIPNADLRLRSGMPVEVTIPGSWR
jgi:HlyD family secretion protein